jgi:hypothetical protein
MVSGFFLRVPSRSFIHPGHIRHVQINEHDVELSPLDRLQRFLTLAADLDAVSLGSQERTAALSKGALIVDDEHPEAQLGLAVQFGELRNGVAGCVICRFWGRRHPTASVALLPASQVREGALNYHVENK